MKKGEKMVNDKLPKKQLTYEELARKYDITPNKAHSIVKSAYNKMVKNLMEMESINEELNDQSYDNYSVQDIEEYYLETL